MGELEGKVAFITGAARGQGRSHALRLAAEGADIIAVDICADIASMDYPNASLADLDETASLVKGLGRRVVARQADIRDVTALRRAFNEGVTELGRLDIVLANAGIVRLSGDDPDPEATWQDIIGTNLSGAWHTIQVALPVLIEQGTGGAIVITGSTAAIRPTANEGVGALAYTAAKWGLVGMTKQLAATYAARSIRVNSVHPTGVRSGMTMNEAMGRLAAQAAAGGDNSISAMQNAMPIDILEPEDVSEAVAFLVSDRARYITGIVMPVDAGFSIR
jgi:SDR family mycofactocin-dependent oxidoreductase